MSWEPIVYCRTCGDPLDVYKHYADRFCDESCAEEYAKLLEAGEERYARAVKEIKESFLRGHDARQQNKLCSMSDLHIEMQENMTEDQIMDMEYKMDRAEYMRDHEDWDNGKDS